MANNVKFYDKKMSKVALIIETREHKALPFVIESVMDKLSEDWKLQIFHGTDNIDYIKSITGNELNDRIGMKSYLGRTKRVLWSATRRFRSI